MNILHTTDFDSFCVRHELSTIKEIVKKMDNGMYVTTDILPRISEGIVKNIIFLAICRMPIPPLLMHELESGKFECVNNAPIFLTLQKFLCDDFALPNVGNPEIDNLKFSELHPKYKNRIEDTMIDLQIFDNRIVIEDCKTLADVYNCILN